MKVTVHHLNNSRSQRVLWLLEELGVEYDIEFYERDPKTIRAPESLRQIHPLGKSPVVTIDNDVVLAESGAVIEELLDRFGNGRLRPELGTSAHRRYRFWLHYAEGSLMPPLLVKLVIQRIRSAPMPFFVKPIAKGIAEKVDAGFTDPELRKHFAFIEQELAGKPWFCGSEFTGADVQMSFPMEAAMARAGAEDHPNMAGFVERIRARPAYQRAVERGGPYDIVG